VGWWKRVVSTDCWLHSYWFSYF